MATITSLSSITDAKILIVPRLIEGTWEFNSVWRAEEVPYSMSSKLSRLKDGISTMTPDPSESVYTSSDDIRWRYLGCIKAGSAIGSEEFNSAIEKIHSKHPTNS